MTGPQHADAWEGETAETRDMSTDALHRWLDAHQDALSSPGYVGEVALAKANRYARVLRARAAAAGAAR